MPWEHVGRSHDEDMGPHVQHVADGIEPGDVMAAVGVEVADVGAVVPVDRERPGLVTTHLVMVPHEARLYREVVDASIGVRYGSRCIGGSRS